MSPPRIGVVGGGLAGIAAALAAADAGAEVVLVERRPTLGGLTSSITRNGLSFDNGQHVFLRCCTAYRALLERIGAGDQVFLQEHLNVPVLSPSGRRASIRSSPLPAPLHLLGSLARYRHLSIGERLRLGRPALALRRLDPDDASLDAISFGDWLTAHGQSERAIERLWDLIALPTLNLPAREASLALAVKVFRVGLLERSDSGDIGWSLVPLAQLHGANAARALVSAGVEQVLGSSVGSIERSSSGAFTICAGDRRLGVEAVVVATPPRVAAALGAFPQDGAPAGGATPAGGSPAAEAGAPAERLGTSPIVNVHLVLDRRVTDLVFAACVESPIQFLFDRTASSGVSSGQCLSISLSAADSYVGRGSPELVSTFTDALRDLFPAARDARVLDAVVTRERAATFRAVPGVRSLRPPARTEVPGLYLAGAWCDTGWPATMEGAVRSGRKAASEAFEFVSGAGSAERPQLEGAKL